MASPTRTLTVNFVGRTDNLQKSFKRVQRGADSMGERLRKSTFIMGRGLLAVGAASVGVAMALKPMIDKAAEVEESLSKNTVVFGDSTEAVEQFAKRALVAFGVTRREALEATGVIGALGSAMGMAEADSAKMATTLVGLAGDMASFNNASVEETLTAIQAGLRGENEPLRRFGVLLDAVTLKNKALEKGIIKNTKEALTPQTKALAAYAVILEQTQIQMGDFERTSDSATNQQKLFAGAIDDLQVAIGEMLLPTFTAAAAWMNENLVPWAEELLVEIETKGPFRAIGNEIGEQMRSGTEIALGDWTEDTTWWSMNLLNPIQEWMVRGLAFIAEGAGLIQFGGTPEPTFQTQHVRPGVFPESPVGAGERARTDPSAHPMAQALDSAQAVADALSDPDGALTRKGMVEANIAGAAAAAEVLSDAFIEPAKEASAAAAADPELDKFLSIVGTPDWDNFIKAMAHGGPPNTQITIQSTAVSGQEVVDALGAFVDTNGPLPPHWQQSATD